MASLASRKRPTGSFGGTRPFARSMQVAAPPCLVISALALLLPVAIGSGLGSSVVLGAALTGLLLVVLGTERLALTLLVAGFGFAPLNDVKPIPTLSFVTASDMFLMLAVSVLVPTLLTRSFKPPVLFAVGAVGVMATGLLSSISSSTPYESLNGVLRLVVGALILPTVFSFWKPGRGVAVILAIAYVVGAAISVLSALISGVPTFENRYAGLTEHPNILGLCSMLGLALVPFILNQTTRRFHVMMLMLAALCAYGVWLSGSRAALVVAAAIAALYPFIARSVGAALWLFGLAIIPIYVVGGTLLSGEVDDNPLGRFLGGGSASASDQAREAVAAVARKDFSSHPLLGVGFNDVLAAHNIYLQIAAAGGVAVLVFYVVLLTSVVWHPFTRGACYHMLALPALAYALIGPLTTLLWDRYIWCVIALPFLLSAARESSDEVVPGSPNPLIEEFV